MNNVAVSKNDGKVQPKIKNTIYFYCYSFLFFLSSYYSCVTYDNNNYYQDYYYHERQKTAPFYLLITLTNHF